MKVLCALACATFGCATPDAVEMSAEEQATWNDDGEAPGEVIEVEGELDPNWEGPDQGAPGNTYPGEPSGGGGGGNGGAGPGAGGGGGPGKQPIRKECGPDQGHEECYACCYYNHDHVDGWKCRRIKNDNKRRECWEKAAKTLGDCQRGCPPPPVITIGAP
jgi:hypothetical protein